MCGRDVFLCCKVLYFSRSLFVCSFIAEKCVVLFCALRLKVVLLHRFWEQERSSLKGLIRKEIQSSKVPVIGPSDYVGLYSVLISRGKTR